MNLKPKIIFMGTPEFGAIILEKLIKTGYQPVLVITETDKPVGRKQALTPSAVKLVAQKYRIPTQYTIYNIQDTSPDLIIVAAYGQILPKEILEIPKYGCLNVHPSLLPRWRGPSPIQSTLLNGDEETGVSIIEITEKVDAGPIIAKEKFNDKIEKLTYGELHNKLAELGGKLLIETIPKWLKGDIKPQPQDKLKATYTKILRKDDAKIDWKKPAEEIERQIRAFDPWPGSHAFWQLLKEKLVRIKILKARLFKSPDGKNYQIGKVLIVPQNEIGVQCGRDFLVIEELQIEGGKPAKAEEFLRGHPDFIGTILK